MKLTKVLMLLALLGIGIAWYRSSDLMHLKCVISKVDGNTYCVRDTARVQQSADLLAKVTVRMRELVAYMDQQYGSDVRVQRLVKNFNPKRIVETLPNSEFTAYSENKGSKLAFCLRKDKDKLKLIDLNTLTFVAIHELSHLTTVSVGHHDDFWVNFKFLLENAVSIGIYNSVDYSAHPQEYCGMTISENPLFRG
jgi:hypothetical protein